MSEKDCGRNKNCRNYVEILPKSFWKITKCFDRNLRSKKAKFPSNEALYQLTFISKVKPHNTPQNPTFILKSSAAACESIKNIKIEAKKKTELALLGHLFELLSFTFFFFFV